ncbi:DUF6117 family protein [Pseudochelatococcus sp. B33]
MAIPDSVRTNFHTLLRAADDGNLALMECLDAVTRERRYVVCAVGRADDGDIVMTPFGHLADGNPYDAYLPSDPDDPNGFIDKSEDGDAS